MAERWEREALARGWRPPADGADWAAPVLWTSAAFAVGLGAAWLWWEEVGRRLVRENSIASLPARLDAAGSAAAARPADPARASEADQLDALASEVSVAALSDGEAADPTAAPAQVVAETAPKPRARRKKPPASASAEA